MEKEKVESKPEGLDEAALHQLMAMANSKPPRDLWRYRGARNLLRPRDFKSKQVTVKGYVKKPELDKIVDALPAALIIQRESRKKQPDPESITSIKWNNRVHRAVARRIWKTRNGIPDIATSVERMAEASGSVSPPAERG